ncbi:MAG TPA: hypothetical protein VND93_22935 [Myxococcales bacterium]|nr:hypothetical protein [Myxococcales bacterium]
MESRPQPAPAPAPAPAPKKKKKKHHGFFHKIGHAIGKAFKKIAPIAKAVLPVAGAVLAPFTGGASLVASSLASSALNVAKAVKNKDWLGVAKGVLGGVGGVLGSAAQAGGAIGQIATGKVAQTLGNVAEVASRGIDIVHDGVTAAKNGNPGGVIQAVGRGLGTVSDLFGGAGDALKQWGGKVEQAGNAVLSGQKAFEAVKNGDFGGAIKSGVDAFKGIAGLFG